MYTCAVKVDIGVSEEQNDDRMLLGGTVFADNTNCVTVDKDPLLAAVCDGVGGLAKGYMASEITLKFLSFLNRSGVGAETLRNAIEEANRRVRVYQQEAGLPNGARATLSGVYAEGERFLVFNAGDSRVYRFRYQYVMQLTKDHSHVQDMIDMGEITPEDARTHPKRNLIYKCIGNEERVDPKILDLEGEFEEQDILMICSDGISDVLTKQEIQMIISAHKEDPDLQECCEALYRKAIENGSLDNLSVMLIRKDG